MTSGSGPFVIFSAPWRFHQADTGTAVPVYLATGAQSGLLGGGFTEITTSRALWNQTGSALTLGPGSTRAAQCFMNYTPGNDGTITISFMDPCAEISDAGGTLAIGGAYYSTAASDQKVVNGTLFNKALQGMIVNNNSATALGYLTRSRCFQDIETHELGHVIGLDHSQNVGAVIDPFIDGACLSAFSAPGEVGAGGITGALHQDDVDGVRFIYPPLTPGAATLTSPSGAISTSNPTFVWSAVGNATQYYLWVNRGITGSDPGMDYVIGRRVRDRRGQLLVTSPPRRCRPGPIPGGFKRGMAPATARGARAPPSRCRVRRARRRRRLRLAASRRPGPHTHGRP